CGPFTTLSRMRNRAAATVSAPVLCFLNGEIEVNTKNWLEELVCRVLQAQVGVVGAALYFPDNTVCHAGLILGAGGIVGRQFFRMPRGQGGYFSRGILEQDLSC